MTHTDHNPTTAANAAKITLELEQTELFQRIYRLEDALEFLAHFADSMATSQPSAAAQWHSLHSALTNLHSDATQLPNLVATFIHPTPIAA